MKNSSGRPLVKLGSRVVRNGDLHVSHNPPIYINFAIQHKIPYIE